MRAIGYTHQMSNLLYSTLLDVGKEHSIFIDSPLENGVLDSELSQRTTIPLNLLIEAIEIVVKKTGKPELSLEVATRIPLRALDVLGFAVISSKNIREALLRLERFHRIVSWDAHLDIEYGDLSASLRLSRDLPKGVANQFATEAAFGLFLVLLEKMTGTRSLLEEVRFSHSITNVSCYEDFFQCPVRCISGNHSIMTLGLQTLERPNENKNYNGELIKYFDQQAQSRLDEVGKYHEAPIINRIKQIIPGLLLSGEISAERTARALNISRRTLYRELNNQQTSFGEVLQKTRMEQADVFLSQGIPAKEISFLLGYSDPASFYRAFKQWFGCTVREYRDRDFSG